MAARPLTRDPALALRLPGWTTPTHRQGWSAEARQPFQVPAVAQADAAAIDAGERPASHGWLWLWALLLAWYAQPTRAAFTAWQRQVGQLHAPMGPWDAALAHGAAAGAAAVHPGHPPRVTVPWPQQVQAQTTWDAWWADAQTAWILLVVEAIQRQDDLATLRQTVEDAWHRAGTRWQREAATQVSTVYHDSLLAAVTAPTWGYVRAIGDDRVCPRCRRLLEGRWFRLLAEAPKRPTPDDWARALWPGKPAQRDGQAVPALPQHPLCRHVVTAVRPTPPH